MGKPTAGTKMLRENVILDAITSQVAKAMVDKMDEVDEANADGRRLSEKCELEARGSTRVTKMAALARRLLKQIAVSRSDGGSNFLTYYEDMEPRGDGGSNFQDDVMTLLTEFLNSADVDCAPFDQELINTLAEKIKMIVGIADDVFKDIIDHHRRPPPPPLADAPKEWRGAAAAPRRGRTRSRRRR